MNSHISRILVIGDVMLDKYVIGDCNRQSPEADCAILDYNKTEFRLGGAANVAFNLNHLNQKVKLVSVIGDDKAGEQVEQLCKTNNIPFLNIKDKSRPTTVKTRYVDSEFKQFLRLDNESTEKINPEIEESLVRIVNQIAEQGLDQIILQDYNKGILSETLIIAIQKICIERNIKLCVDPKKDNFALLSKCDLFKPNLKELEQQYGHAIQADSDQIRNVLKTLQLNDSKQIYVTLAEKGIYYQEGDEYGIIDGVTIASADVSGAGDTVISVLSTLLAFNTKCSKMASVANKCGVFVCKKQGVSYINNSDFQIFIHKYL